MYSAAPEGTDPQIYSIRAEYPEARPMGLPSTQLLAISRKGELAVLTHPRYVNHRFFAGTLARAPLGGGSPREILADVREADWAPDAENLAVIRDIGGRDQLEYPVGRVLWRGGGYLSDPRVSPKGDRVAFFEHPSRYDDRGIVVAVDREGKRTVLSGDYQSEEGLAWSPNGDEVFFSATVTGGNGLTVFSVTQAGKRRVVLQSAGGLTLHDVSAAGRMLVTRDDRRLGLIVRAPGESEDRDLSWLDESLAPVIAGDGRALTFTDQSEGAGPLYAVALRKTDGTPVVRLGEGRAEGLSPDGAWALAIVPTTPQQLRIYPTGPGQPRTLERGSIEAYDHRRGAWFHDARSVLVCARESGRATRCYAQDIAAGAPRPVTPEGTSDCIPSPDGTLILAAGSEQYALYPAGGGPSRPLPLRVSEDTVLRFSPDGKALWLRRPFTVPVRIERLDLETMRREPLEEITPQNRAGLKHIFAVSLADDPHSYVYNPFHEISQLFVVEGAR